MASSGSATGSYAFGEYRLDRTRGTLMRAGVDVELRPKSYAVLCYLVEQHGELVTRKELLHAIWGPAIVTEGTLTQSLVDIRRALDDNSQAMLRTVHGRGYLFDVPVDWCGRENTAPTLPGRASTAGPTRHRRTASRQESPPSPCSRSST